MKLTKDTSSTSSIEGTAMKLVDLEGDGDYYALMSALVSYLDLSYGVVQRAATKLGCYKTVKDMYCVPVHMLHALCLELRKRYPKKLKVQELYAATLPEPTDATEPVTTPLSVRQALPTEEPKEPERQLKREERKVTAQELPPLCSSEGEEKDFYTVLPKELKEWTFDVLKASDAGGLALLYRWVALSESATLQELWGNYVYELHKLDEFYPKLRYRLSVIYEYRKNPLGKLKLLKV